MTHIHENIYQPVQVEWYDSVAHEDTWCSLEEAQAKEVPLIRTIGYLILEDETSVKLVQSYGMEESAQVGGAFVIPLGCVKSIRELKMDTPGRGSL